MSKNGVFFSVILTTFSFIIHCHPSLYFMYSKITVIEKKKNVFFVFIIFYK